MSESAHLGLTLPRELMAPDPSNAHGYFESWELAGLHNRVLGAAGSRWDDPSPIADAWFEGPSARACAGEIVGLLDRGDGNNNHHNITHRTRLPITAGYNRSWGSR